jgi:hypothetical protein
VGTGGLKIYSERRIVDNILDMSGGKANYFWKDEVEYKWKARDRTKEISGEAQ